MSNPITTSEVYKIRDKNSGKFFTKKFWYQRSNSISHLSNEGGEIYINKTWAIKRMNELKTSEAAKRCPVQFDWEMVPHKLIEQTPEHATK